MTPTEALPIIAAIGKRLKDPQELEAFRLAFRALQNPLEAQIEALQTLRQGSRVSVRRLEDDPELGPWCAWIEWREYSTYQMGVRTEYPREMAELGKTPQEAISKLREALEKKPEVKT